MNVFDRNLESLEAAGFGNLNFAQKIQSQVFVDDAVGRRKECQCLFDEMAFSVIERGPILEIGNKIELFGCPERSFGLFVKFPNLSILKRKKHKPVGIFLAQVVRHFIYYMSKLDLLCGRDKLEKLDEPRHLKICERCNHTCRDIMLKS